jgi:hypothetical protein
MTMDVLDLFARISLDSSEYDRGLDRAEQKASSFGSKAASLLGGGLKTAAKVGVAAIGAATTAVGALTKASVDGYAEFEQLRGGIQKLYGNMGQSLEEYTKAAVESGQPIEEAKQQWASLETAQNAVMENAKNAYATVGISANEYMEAATSFSAALINSLGGDTVKAAEQADVAMRAMADNVNTFGTNMASVQYAFQGFAKQNYTIELMSVA